jgi:RNA polymerase sigma factor (sigma-70 family)
MPTQVSDPIEDLRALCERVVARLMARYNWQLLEEDDFVRVVLERAQAGGLCTETAIARVAKNEYALVLYDACHPGRNPGHLPRHQRGYEELGRYLYDIAYHRRPGRTRDAEDATQRALLDIHQALRDDRCRKPGAFLAFCIGRLRGALTWVDRSHKVGGKPPTSLDVPAVATGEPNLVEGSAASPGEEAERRLLGEAIRTELEHKFQKHPRAVQQLRAVILKYVGDCSNREIGAKLGITSAGAVSTLISRGRKKLENNREFRDLAVLMLSR